MSKWGFLPSFSGVQAIIVIYVVYLGYFVRIITSFEGKCQFLKGCDEHHKLLTPITDIKLSNIVNIFR